MVALISIVKEHCNKVQNSLCSQSEANKNGYL